MRILTNRKELGKTRMKIAMMTMVTHPAMSE